MAGGACDFFSDDTTPTTPSSPAATETFSGSLALTGSNLYTFTVAQGGPVTITLSSLTPAPAVAGLAFGTPSGTTACTRTSSNPTAAAGSAPQISVTASPGSYCVEIYDVGRLTSPSTFVILIAHS